jgi:hypothetical protein
MRADTSDETAYEILRDVPPEYLTYTDEGCELAPACLECPLPQCVHDAPEMTRYYANRDRNREIARQRLAGVPVAELAAKYGVSRRTVYRVTAEYTAEDERHDD